jgi:hypothetical protein
MINFETKKVLFIDLDSTLIQTISGKTFPEDITDFRIQLPVLNKIVEKLPNLNSFYIVTNQGGVGTYYTKEDIETKLRTIEVFCQRYLDTYYNFPDDEFVMNRLFRSMGIAVIVLLFIVLLPVIIFIIAGILTYFGMNSILALLIGAAVALFIVITIDVYRQQGC